MNIDDDVTDILPEEPDWFASDTPDEQWIENPDDHFSALDADTISADITPDTEVSVTRASLETQTSTKKSKMVNLSDAIMRTYATTGTTSDTQHASENNATNRSEGKRQLILDTETTGLDASKERIIEIGIIEMIDRQLTGDTFHVYLNPQKDVGESERIHGLSNAFLSDKALFKHIAHELSAYLKGAEIIAHNANFDIKFLEAEFAYAGLEPLSPQITITDSLALAKSKHPTQKNSLDALAKRYEIRPRDRQFHGALLDAEILADVYLAMTGGQVSLIIEENHFSGEMTRHQNLSGITHRPPVIKAHDDELALHTAWLAEQKIEHVVW